MIYTAKDFVVQPKPDLPHPFADCPWFQDCIIAEDDQGNTLTLVVISTTHLISLVYIAELQKFDVVVPQSEYYDKGIDGFPKEPYPNSDFKPYEDD